jgi:hypothetical protein
LGKKVLKLLSGGSTVKPLSSLPPIPSPGGQDRIRDIDSCSRKRWEIAMLQESENLLLPPARAVAGG